MVATVEFRKKKDRILHASSQIRKRQLTYRLAWSANARAVVFTWSVEDQLTLAKEIPKYILITHNSAGGWTSIGD